MPQEKVIGREYAARNRAAKSGNLDAYLEGVLYDEPNTRTGGWDNTTTHQPDTIDRKNRADK